MEIGIIGFGRFGKLITRYLAEDFDVYVYNKSDKKEEIKEAKGIPANIEEVCKKDIVIPCVPISQFEKVINGIKDLVKKDSLVIDVCSVKEYPVRVMQHLLKDVEILATHPMFGPDSASQSLNGQKMVLCNVSTNNELYTRIKGYLSNKQIKIIEKSAQEHDKDMAKTLFLTHFIGRSLIEFKADKKEIDTEGYKRLLKILEVVENDSVQLFYDMYNYNSYAKEITKKFLDATDIVNGGLIKNENSLPRS